MVEGSMTQGAGQGPMVFNEGSHGAEAGREPHEHGAPAPSHALPHPTVAHPTTPGPHPPVEPVPGAPAPAVSPAPPAPPVPPVPPTPPVAPPRAQPPASPAPQPGATPPATPAATPAPAPQPAAVPPPPAEEPDPDYTPTERDLPVISREDPEREPTLLDTPTLAPQSEEGDGPVYVVGDVHGYLDELRRVLLEVGLIDEADHWAGDNARLWFLGDFTDRGPDGIGVIELVMQLSAEAAAAGGYCKALMGNHELLLIGAKRFGDTPVQSGAGTASFQAAWLLNGGQRTDMERLEERHIQWMTRLDAMALVEDHLLLHSDASCYLDYGNNIEAVNDAVTVALQQLDADTTWDLFRKFTKRFAFRDEEEGVATARELLSTFGGHRIVHGHSPIPYLTGEVPEEGDDTPPTVRGPHVYADGLAVAMDGGVTMSGKLLVTRLPLEDEESPAEA
ncbi:metallophosphoesterase [Streptomyces sp. NPDC005438]|uniref:metallophosphoesterase n=1 Tax=Streptomyces sp. NPDC005438 TaxID=3156880 RepID=UPI0033AEE974